MLIFIFIFTAILFILFLKVLGQKNANPLSFFLIILVFWIIMSKLNVSELYVVSQKTYVFLYLYMFFFSIGYIIIGNYKNEKKNRDNKINTLDYSLRKMKKYYYIQVLITLVLIMYLYRYINLTKNVPIGESLRSFRFSTGTLFKYELERLFYDYVISTIIRVSLITNITRFYLYNKTDKHLAISFLNIGLYSFIGIGRLAIFDMILYILITYLFVNNNTRSKPLRIKKRKSKLYILSVLTIGLFTMVRLSAYKYRNNFSLDTFKYILSQNIKNFVVYFTGPFVAFDLALKNNVISRYQYTFGRSTLAGFDEVIGIVLNKIGFNYDSGSYIIGEITSQSIYIGKSQSFNAFYSALLNFYLDGGVLGIILLSFIFGGLVGKSYRYFNQNKNICTAALLVYLTWMSITSIYRFPSTFSHILTGIILYIASKYSYRKNGSEY